jgi:hypothetical protein
MPLRVSGEAPSPIRAQTQTGEVLFIATATVLLRVGRFTLLTDPNFLHQGQHAKLGYGPRSRRLTEPARTIDQPPRSMR